MIIVKPMKNETQPYYVEVGSVLNVIENLSKYKGTQLACYLLFRLYYSWAFWKKVTKKQCTELLNCSPTQALKILQQVNVLDFQEWRLNEEANYSALDSQVEVETPYTKFSWKYGNKFHTTFKSYWNILIPLAEGKGYTVEEYFDSLMSIVKEDKWWKNVITEEMALRKITFLENKFGHRLPKKVTRLDEISHIF